MGWDEAAFGYILKKLGRIKNKRDSDPRLAARLADHTPRFRLLCCTLAGESLEVTDAEDYGGWSGTRLFLPSEIKLFESETENIRAYIHRIAYSLASRGLGFFLGSDCPTESHARALTLLALPQTREHLLHELPASRRYFDDLANAWSPPLLSLTDGQAPVWSTYLHLALDWALPDNHNKTHLQKAEEIMNLARAVSPASLGRPGAQCLLFKTPDPSCLGGAAYDPAFLLLGHLLEPTGTMGPSPAEAPEGLSADSLSTGTEKKAKARERTEEVQLGDKKDDESPLVHVFEKVLTADEYNAGKKNLDGSDELEEHHEAIEELNLRHVIRSRDRAQSIYKSDAIVDGGAPDLMDSDTGTGEPVHYDEWDHSKKSYRPSWCRIYAATARPLIDDSGHEQPAAKLPDSQKSTVKKLRAELEKALNERRWKNRQIDGAELDLDALVDWRADLIANHTPSQRMYLSRRRCERDLAATILIDMSLSTDSWVDNKHVIQIARDAVLVLADVLDGLSTKVSVAGFHSNTRRDCRYIEFKGFDESWQTLRRRLPALTPTGYTRIGPAIRHATSELSETGSRKKMLLLISDGKPTDYDRYEGRYGIQDVRQALKEAAQAGIQTRSLAIDSQAKFYLPQMFGNGGLQILPNSSQLAMVLSKIFAQCLV